MQLQFPIRAVVLTLVLSACTTSALPPPTTPVASVAPTIAPSPTRPAVIPTAPQPPDVPVLLSGIRARAWYTVPDGVFDERPTFTVTFVSDAGATAPRLRIRPGDREVGLIRGANVNEWTATIDLSLLQGVGTYTATVVERVARGDVEVGEPWTFHVSQPEYVVWTLDFEGDAASDETMANTLAISAKFAVPMTVLWNPRVWLTTQVTRERADAMQRWMTTLPRVASGSEPGITGQHEIGLHLHMWTDYVQAAGIAPKLSPRWAGRLDGYDVPITAYTEDEQSRLIAYGLQLMADHGLSGVTSFRAGGDFADAATLRALVTNGITADCTAVPAGTFGSLRWPWTLPADPQPYRPARDDANKPGDLPLLEAPTNAGNTYAYTTSSIAPIVRADLAMLARTGEVATARKGLTIVSHPGTIDATERAAIETLFRAFDALRYDQNRGPLRFVTLRQLAQAWR